jgi:hypothetical protein
MPGTILAATDVIHADGYLYATEAGLGVDSTPFAELHDFQIRLPAQFDEMPGVGINFPIAVVQNGEELTITASIAKCRPNALKALFGGAVTKNASITAWLKKTTHNRPKFDLHYQTPLSGGDLDIIIWGCVCTSGTLPLPGKQFVIPNFEAKAFGNSANDLIQIIFPGDKTTS